MGGLGAILGPMPGFMYAYRCTPLPLMSTSGVAGPVTICPGARTCCELLPCVVGPESARFTGASSLSPAGRRMCAQATGSGRPRRRRIRKLAPVPLRSKPWLRNSVIRVTLTTDMTRVATQCALCAAA